MSHALVTENYDECIFRSSQLETSAVTNQIVPKGLLKGEEILLFQRNSHIVLKLVNQEILQIADEVNQPAPSRSPRIIVKKTK